jgi:hypothetical protein
MDTASPGQTVDQILSGHHEYEATTIAGVVDGREYTIASFRAISSAFFDSRHWKNPWTGKFSSSMVPLVIEITRFYHGDVPEVIDHDEATDTVTMRGRGYRCD